MKLEKLEERLAKAEEDFNNKYYDDRARGLGFVGAGCLSGSSRKYLDRNHKEMAKLADKINVLKIAIKVVKEEPFTLKELNDLQKYNNDYVNVYITGAGIMAGWVRKRLSIVSKKLAETTVIKIDFEEGRILEVLA